MSEENSFVDLLRRARAGEQNAIEELVRRYEPHVRRVASIRLRSARLRRVLDSMDIRQSVLKSFFFRAAMGQYELQTADDLLKLLATLVRNKIVDKSRREQAACRDHRRLVAEDVGEVPVAGAAATPSQILSEQELCREALRRLSPEERQLHELKAQGLEWSEIAARLGGTPEGRRKQLARAIDSIAGQLGLDE